MIDRVLDTIEKNKLIKYGDNVVAGVSGGPDSICLLHVLNSLANRLGIKIYAVHINHMLRGEEAERDEQYVRSFCERLGVPLYSKAINIREYSKVKRISLEEAGREVRYHEFDAVADSIGKSKIAVAHNKNDQAETVLMNIIRGSGLDGLKGMDYIRGRIIRPLLDIERKDIENYCKNHSLNPILDSSNVESIYTRNKIRLNLIPYINTNFSVDIMENICRMSGLIKDDSLFIEESAKKLYDQCIVNRQKDAVLLDILKFRECHPSMKKQIIRHALKEVKGDLKGFERVHIESVVDLGINGATGSQIHLPCNFRAERSYNVLKIFHFKNEAGTAVFSELIKIPGITRIESLNSSVEAFLEKNKVNVEKYMNIRYNSLVQFFDYDKLRMGINIRNREAGDVFKPYRSSGTKKLKEYFIDNKIPRDIRESIPIVAMGREIVWVIGYNISDKFKVTENTKSVLRLEYKILN